MSRVNTKEQPVSATEGEKGSDGSCMKRHCHLLEETKNSIRYISTTQQEKKTIKGNTVSCGCGVQSNQDILQVTDNRCQLRWNKDDDGYRPCIKNRRNLNTSNYRSPGAGARSHRQIDMPVYRHINPSMTNRWICNCNIRYERPLQMRYLI